MNKSFNGIKKVLLNKARQLGIRRPEPLCRRHPTGIVRRIIRAGQYKKWLRNRSEHSAWFVSEYRALAKQGNLPTISLLMPVYNPPISFLKKCLDSVVAQVYPHWQLCVVTDASCDPQVRQCLTEFSQQDSRIDAVFLEENSDIANPLNTALGRVTGDFVGLLDHEDMLAAHALLRVAEQLAAKPELALIYSDEDRIDVRGKRSTPHFKPSWNPDLLLGQNYISHLTVLNIELVRSAGGFRTATENSQDYDLLLRCMPHLHSGNVAHIADVLYHRRMIKGAKVSSGDDFESKAGLRVLADYLSVNHSGAKALKGQVPDSYRVMWPLPDSLPKVSLLIPTRDGIDILKPCVNAILEKTDYANFEVLILDNQTRCSRTLAYFDELAVDNRVSIHRWDHPFNYSAINNFGVSLATGDIVGLVNNDIEPINSDWLREMVSQAARPEIGCVGAKLYYPDGRIQHAGVILGVGGVAGHAHKYFPADSEGYFSRLKLVQNLSAVTAACLLVRKAVFNEVGGLDEKRLAVAFNDVDFCLKVREAGYRNLWTPYAELYHHESVSRGPEDTDEKRARFKGEITTMQERWGKALDTDPAYNLNLSRQRDDFSLKR